MELCARGGLEPRFRVLFSAIFQGMVIGRNRNVNGFVSATSCDDTTGNIHVILVTLLIDLKYKIMWTDTKIITCRAFIFPDFEILREWNLRKAQR